MPRAPDGVANEQALFERSTIVGANCADGEDFVAATRKEDGLALRVPQQHRSIADRRKSDPIAQVRSAQLWLAVIHGNSPTQQDEGQFEPQIKLTAPFCDGMDGFLDWQG